MAATALKYQEDNRPLSIAITASVLLHAALLAVRIVAPDAFHMVPTDPGLEVILVNAKHEKPPVKAEALAQANLEGGGAADEGRSKSPLPDLHRMDTGDSIKATQRRIAELEQLQRDRLTQLRQSALHAPPITDKDKPDPTKAGQDLLESSKAIARAAAEIAERIEDENKRPRKTYLTPSTRQVGYAMYYNAMAKRIEDIGTLMFPQKDGRKLYGELVMSIPVFQDGTIYVKDGGIEVKKSSGNRDLDQAAINIVRRAAPFGRFPPNMLSSDKDDLWVVLITFKFTSRGRLEAESRGGAP